MASKLLTVDHLTLRAKHGHVFSNVSFHVNKGEIIALTGPSGSGKSSIANAILGFLPEGIELESGIITWHSDEGILKYPDHQKSWAALRGRHIGFIQQDIFGMFDPVLKLGPQMMMLIMERIAKPIENLSQLLKIRMEEVGLYETDRLWNSYPHQLSGGQLQRCQLCICTMLEPELIIADEPTSAIDKIHQLEILDLFDRIRNKYGTAILCITHEESIVRYIADREILLQEKPETVGTIPHAVLHETLVILEADHLGYDHRYGGIIEKGGAGIRDISFRLSQGKCLGILGESGSGKSTLANILVGLLHPLEGTLKLHDEYIDFDSQTGIRKLRKKIQMVMQDGRGSLHPYKSIKTLFEEVINHLRKEDKSLTVDIEVMLSEVGLPAHILHRKPDSLSGGECLRVAIARALLINPDILICDESTSSLDGPNRDTIIRLLQNLMEKRKLAIVFISHDSEVIRLLAHDVMILAEGEVIEFGALASILESPKSEVASRIFSTEATLSRKKHL